MRLKKVNVLGVGVNAVNMTQALQCVENWIMNGERRYVCVTPVHSVIESHNSEQLRAIYNAAGLVTPDGMPIVWLCRMKGFKHTGRVYGPDLMLAICERSLVRRYSHFFYGGAERVLEKLTANLQQRYPGLKIAGTYSPPFRPLSENENAKIVDMINEAKPDVVWVGLGAPKQERWMAAQLGKVRASVLIGVGAAFDFHAGTKKQAPLWMQRNGLEWLFRLVTEPRRLWKRYLVSNTLFVILVLLQALGLRKYHL